MSQNETLTRSFIHDLYSLLRTKNPARSNMFNPIVAQNTSKDASCNLTEGEYCISGMAILVSIVRQIMNSSNDQLKTHITILQQGTLKRRSGTAQAVGVNLVRASHTSIFHSTFTCCHMYIFPLARIFHLLSQEGTARFGYYMAVVLTTQ